MSFSLPLTVFAATSGRGRFEETPEVKHEDDREASIGGNSRGRCVGIGARRAQARHTRVYPGMSYQEVMSAMAKICKGKPDAVESAD